MGREQSRSLNPLPSLLIKKEKASPLHIKMQVGYRRRHPFPNLSSSKCIIVRIENWHLHLARWKKGSLKTVSATYVYMYGESKKGRGDGISLPDYTLLNH